MRVPGSCLANIFYVRSYKDANRVSEASAGKEVVILGSSFIAMEAAAFLKNKASSVTVVARSSVPFASILGDEVGKRIKALFESKGISFHMNSQVHHFEGEDEGQGIKNIHLNTGQVLSAQVCVVGLGIILCYFILLFILKTNLLAQNNNNVFLFIISRKHRNGS